jgi:NADH-quinone oxidoreductase subunit M
MLSLAIAVPLLGMIFFLRRGQTLVAHLRGVACMLIAISFAACGYGAAMVWQSGQSWVEGLLALDSFGSIPLALFCGLGMVTVLAMPRVDCTARNFANLLGLIAGTILAYTATDLGAFAAGWAITLLPFFLVEPGDALAARWAGLASVLLLIFAHFAGGSWMGFACLAAAALLRKGIFPFHFWLPQAFEKSSPEWMNLFVNGHLAAVLIARFGLNLYPDQSHEALGVISFLALFTALYAAIAALSELSTRRVIALLSLSQASFILAGLESRNAEGITGAMVHWLVVAVATTGITLVYRLIEARSSRAARLNSFLGLAGRMPRLAVFFAVFGLALVGLPGTLGFVAEDLLFHGALESHPMLGLALPLATALNAISILRVFARIFLGKAPASVAVLPDAYRTERWAVSVCAVVLVIGGVLPQIAIDLRQPAADVIAKLLAATSH